MPAVNTSNAISCDAATTTWRRTDSTVPTIVRSSFVRRSLEGGQRALPEPVEVGAQDRQPGRVDAVEAARARLAVDDQPDVLEHLEVLGHGWAADRQLGRQLAHRPRPVGQAVEDRPARRVAQG